ncbi:hypothetical protein DXG01_016660 [Tephrocybe rancida]|nr:hypothetical protein DXG01_016660 [Tephrocybe rancida]
MVQVGEDAYFVREGAVGVADGVGGWARNLNGSEKPCHTLSSSPSALFAKRLMHYTSAEIEDKPLNDELELEGHLAELEEGIDVLNILERAYENTVRAHAPSREGSSTAVVAVLQCDEDDGEGLYGDMEAEGVYYEGNRRNYEATGKEEGGVRLDVAQVGDCMGMVVRGDEIVWRSEEMWWGFNTPVQLGMPPATAPLPPPATTKYSLPQTHAPSPSQPLSPNTLSSIPKSHAESAPMTITPRTLARLTRVPVRADDILILASDGLSDNLWDEDVLDEVGRFRGTFGRPQSPSSASECLEGLKHPEKEGEGGMGELRRRTMARMLSEALCSRARRVSERRGKPPDREAHVQGVVEEREASRTEEEREREEETPFARRAREAGKLFRGGKKDDISVVVAIVAPVPRVERKLKENL